jgi:hypothetical protein
MSLFCSVCKWQKSVKTVKDIVPSLKQAMQMARSGTLGPVFVELPADVFVPVTTSSQQVLVPNHVVAVPPEVTVPDGIQANARVNADKPGMAASGRACLRPPPGFLENPCLGHATCVHQRGGDVSIPLPVGEAGFPSYADASATNCSACPDVPGNVMTGICNCNFDMNTFLKNVENSV